MSIDANIHLRKAAGYIVPTPSAILAAQNDYSSLRLLLAQRRFHSKAKRWAALRGLGVGIIAVAAPLISFKWPSMAVVIGAISGSWIVLSRTLFLGLERGLAARGAILQERFDLSIFAMPEVTFRFPVVTPEDVSRCVGPEDKAKAAIARESLADWYPIDLTVDGVDAIAIAQRANAAYAERLLKVNAAIWLGLTSLWAVILVVVSLALGLTFSTFLLGVAIPLMPALLDVIDQWRLTKLASGERLQLACSIEDALRGRDGKEIGPEDVLAWQNQLFTLRRDSPQVPNLVYRFMRAQNELAMGVAAAELAEAVKKAKANRSPR
ncbi:MAG: S-4TM family putative pore-forming effector [Fimbriimonadaceae bacterium]